MIKKVQPPLAYGRVQIYTCNGGQHLPGIQSCSFKAGVQEARPWKNSSSLKIDWGCQPY